MLDNLMLLGPIFIVVCAVVFLSVLLSLFLVYAADVFRYRIDPASRPPFQTPFTGDRAW